MPNRPSLKIVGGSATPEPPRYVDPGATATYVRTEVFNQHGQPYLKSVTPGDAGSNGDGSGGGTVVVDVAKLRQSVDWLWKIAIGTVVAGLGIIATVFLTLDDRIQDRFEVTDGKITSVGEKIADLRVHLESQKVQSINIQHDSEKSVIK